MIKNHENMRMMTDTCLAQCDGKAFKKQKVGPIHHPLCFSNRQK